MTALDQSGSAMLDRVADQALIGAATPPRAPMPPDAADGGQAALVAETLRRLEVVTAIIGGWVWETDARHRFIYMSPSVERLAGKKPEWHYGKTRQELGNLSLRTADGGNWLEQLEARTSFGPVDFVRYQNGAAFQMRAIGHPQFDAAGEFIGYIGVAFRVSGDLDPEPAERRSEPRRRIVRAAEIMLAGSGEPIACVLTDISATGARLQLPENVVLPETFKLEVASLSLSERCIQRWCRGGDVGVEFVRD